MAISAQARASDRALWWSSFMFRCAQTVFSLWFISSGQSCLDSFTVQTSLIDGHLILYLSHVLRRHYRGAGLLFQNRLLQNLTFMSFWF